MSQSRESFSSEGASAPGKPRNGIDDDESRSILVSNIPHTLSDDKVMIHFQKSSSGGGDVEQVRRLSTSQAKVIFEDVKVIDRVVARKHELAGVTVQVESWSSFLVRALEMDRTRQEESSCVQRTTVQVHQPMSLLVWERCEHKISKPSITVKRSANDMITFKGGWSDVIHASSHLLALVREAEAAKSPCQHPNGPGSRNGQNQAEGGVTNNLEHREDASGITPAGDSQHHLQAAVNKGTENPDEDIQYHLKRVHLDGKQREGASSARAHQERKEKNHSASSSRSISHVTEIDESREDNLKGFACSQSSEPREEHDPKEAKEYGTQASFEQSRSAPDDGGLSAYGSSSTRPNKEEEQRNGASSRRSTTRMTKNSQKWDDDVVGFTQNQNLEQREKVRQHEARGDERLSGFQRSMCAPDGTSSTYGTSSRGAVGQLDDTYHSPSALNSTKHSSGSKKQGVHALDRSKSIPGKNETKLSDPSMAHQHVGAPQDRTCTSGTYKLLEMSAEDEDDEAMTETTVDQTVDPDIMSFIINVHSSEINKIARKHRVNFDHSKDNSTVYIKGSKTNAKAASEDFITLYQSLFSKLDSRSLDTCLHNIKAGECVDAVKLAQDSHPSVFIKNVDGMITFIGEEQEIREARATICSLLDITESRRRRRNPSSNTSSSSAVNGPSNAQTSWFDLSTSSSSIFWEKTTGVYINIARGDITAQNVDVIVNAANCSLTLAVGVSGAISRAGGSVIQSECTNYIIKHGSPRTTDCVWTKPGRLPCKYIIHAVGPNFVPGSKSKCKQELYDTCQKVLVMAASKLRAKSMAIPAISSGASGMPRRVCTEAMCSAIVDFVENGRGAGSCLLDIRLVDNDREAVKAFCDAFKAKIAKDSSRGATGYSASGATGYNTNGSMTAKYSSSSPSYGSTSPITYPGPTSTYAAAASCSSYPHVLSTALTYPHPTPTYSNSGDLSGTYSGASQTQPSQSLSSFQQTHSTTSQNMSRFSSPEVVSSASSASGNSDKDNECPICLSDFTGPVTTTPCKHRFCADCLDSALKLSGQCPICKSVIGRLKGNQPRGTMTHHTDYLNSLPGFEYSRSYTIEIHYYFPDGVQGPEHPNPGKPYTGTLRRAYLPDNTEGREVLRLLKRAFDSHLVFTIGTSATTGLTDTVVWNDIHHKTSKYGGPNSYGYPDPQYLTRVKEELAAKGIK